MEYIKQTGDRDNKRTKVSVNTSNKLRKISTMPISKQSPLNNNNHTNINQEGDSKVVKQYIGPNNWVERHSFIRLLEQVLLLLHIFICEFEN